MKYLAKSTDLAAALHEQGLVPPNCYKVEVVVRQDNVLALRYETTVDVDDLPKLAAAFAEAAKGVRV